MAFISQMVSKGGIVASQPLFQAGGTTPDAIMTTFSESIGAA
ncbi:MAG: hypothetical protein V7K92_08090 [Nostoc sp.]